MLCYDLLEYHGDLPLLLVDHEEITHALLQYNSCEFNLSDRSYCNNSILFDPMSDYEEKWLLQQGECRLESLSFRRYEYTRRTMNVQKAVVNSHRITSRLKQFPPEGSRVSSIEHLLQAQLCYAAFSGDYDRMQSLLPYCRAHNCECVHYAATGGHVEILCRLLQEGYPVDSTNSHGQNPLHIAALFGWNEAVVELIKRGADIDKPIIEEYTYCPPLDGVVYGLPEHLDTVLAIIDQGYSFSKDEVNAFLLICVRHRSTLMLERKCPDEDGYYRNTVHVATFKRSLFKMIRTGDSKDSEILVFGSALHQASLRGHVSTVRLLLENNCSTHSVDSLGRSALFVAAKSGHLDCVEALIEHHCSVDSIDQIGVPPINHAAEKGRTEVVVLLHSKSSRKDPNARVFGTPLHQAALGGHLETLRVLLDEGCSILTIPDDGRTPLHWAAARGHVDIIRELLRRSCPIDVQDKSGLTALHYAALCGRTEAVVELIKNGAEKDVVAGKCGTPLHQAAKNGHLKTVQTLLDEGCSVSTVDDNGQTGLHWAAAKGHVGIIREFLNRSCSIDTRDKSGCTSLYYAAACGQTEAVVELIKNGTEKDVVAGKFGTPLHQAAKNGHLETVQALLDGGCSVRAVDDSGKTALHWAAQEGHVKIIRELLNRNCPIDIRDKSGCTALHDTAAYGQTDSVVELIKNGAEKDVVAAQHVGTPLHQAANNGHLKTVQALLDGGCSVRAVKDNGETALHWAAQEGHVEIIRELLNRNCPIDRRDKSGCTALYDAAACGQTEAVVELIKNGAEKDVVTPRYIGTPLHQATINGHLETVTALLDEGCSVLAVDNNDRTVLHFAAQRGHVNIIRELLKRNCPIDIRDKSGLTPLHVAATHDQTEAAVELIRNGAEKDFVAGVYGTPLHQAAIKGHLKTAKLLLDEGCCVYAVNDNGGTALHWAAEKGHVEIIRELLRRNCPINKRDKFGRTAFYCAANFGQTKAVVELIKNGAEEDTNSHYFSRADFDKLLDQIICDGHYNMLVSLLNKTHENRDRTLTAGLCKAIQYDQHKMAIMLMDQGCSINNCYGILTPLHHASSYGRTELARMLLRKGAKRNIVAGIFGTPIHQAILNGRNQTFKTLLKDGCSLECVDTRGYTVLHFAVLSGCMEILTELLDQQNRLIEHIEKEERWTPLHLAARYGKTAAAVELIRWGAKKDPISKKGHNPLHLAGVHGHVETFIQLLEEGCSMHLLGYSFLTSLEKQPDNIKNAILTALLERGYNLDVSQASFLTRPLIKAKKRNLQALQMTFNIQEKPTWIQQYHKALNNHGYVRVNIIRCVLVGPPKVGKSCLKHLLVHNQSKEIEHSTPVMESPDVVTFNREMYLVSAQSSTSAWEYVSDEGMGAILRGWAENEEYHPTESYPRSTVASESSSNTVLSTSPPAPNSQSVVPKLTTERQEKEKAYPSTSESVNHWKMKVAHCHLVSQVKEYKTRSNHNQDSLQQITFVNMIDSGGQPAFVDTLPLLLGIPCTYIHVFNASKNVDSLAEMTYRDTDGREKVIASTETTWELMLRSFSSVHTLEYKCSKHLKDVMDDGMPVPPCRIAVVGTFKDELLKSPNHEEIVSGLNSRLKAFNEHAHSSQPIIWDEENNQYLFLVDNLMYKDLEHEMKDSQYINSFRNALSSEDASLKLKIPLMWLMMELVTRKSGVKYIPYRDLKTFSLDHGYIDDNEDADGQFRAILMLFHNLGFYAYYELEGVERENNLVCTEATVLFKEISKLLLIHFITPKSPAAKHFQEKGEILLKDEGYKDLFSEIGVDPNIDSEWFLKVIEHLGLSAKLSYSDLVLGGESSLISSYFIPLALPCGRANLPVKSTVAKLCFTLECWEGLSHTYRLPRVIFPRLIVLLAKNRKNWKPQLPNSDRTTVKFIHKGSFVYISERATLMEVNLLVPKEAFADCGSTFKPTKVDVKELHILCDGIRHDLTEAFTVSCTATFGDSFTKSANVVCGSLCSLCGAEVPHVATPSDGPGKSLMCPGKNQPFPMTSEQQIWFSNIDHSTVQVHLVDGIDSFKQFWVLGSSNSTSTGRVTPVTRQHIDPSKLDLDSKPCESDLVQLVGDCYNLKWKEFGIRLGISGNTCEGISQQMLGDPKVWLALICSKWLSYEVGTGDKPRTWRTVLGARRKCGFSEVADQVPANQILKPPDIHSKPCEADLLELVGDYIDSKWQNFGIELGICKNVCEGIKIQKLCIPKECFILLCSKWLSSGAGTGDKPRTWRTVLDAVRECEFFEVADQVEQSFSKNPVLSSKPDLKDLADLIGGELGPKWSQLGRPLSIDESIITAIQASSGVDCFVDMMRMWLDGREGSGSRPRTWDTVLSGLVEIGNGNLAGQVERRLVKKSSQC